MPFDFDKNELCFTSPEGGVLAKRPTIEDDGGKKLVQWFDASHRRAFTVKKILKDEEGVFSFEDMDGRKWTLRPMTAESYRSEVKPHLVYLGGAPDLRTDEAVREFFLEKTYVL